MSLLNQVKWIDFVSNKDVRGVLTAIESGQDIPFAIKRIFYMHHITTDRGGHAHKETDQVVVAVAGSFKLELFDGLSYKEYEMNDPTKGLYVPRMVFVKISDCSKDMVCLVLSSTHYDINKSIRSRTQYLETIEKNRDEK